MPEKEKMVLYPFCYDKTDENRWLEICTTLICKTEW